MGESTLYGITGALERALASPSRSPRRKRRPRSDTLERTEVQRSRAEPLRPSSRPEGLTDRTSPEVRSPLLPLTSRPRPCERSPMCARHRPNFPPVPRKEPKVTGVTIPFVMMRLDAHRFHESMNEVRMSRDVDAFHWESYALAVVKHRRVFSGGLSALWAIR